MVNPVPGYNITTPYRKSGSWSCGYHTGVDLACPVGTRIVAPIAGQIRHRNYGSALGNHQFAISPDPGQPFAEGEVFFAHTRTRLADGVYVNVGDFVAECGVEGNTTGPHLHYEFHPNQKNSWGCEPVCANPQPTIDHQAGGGGGGSGSDYPVPTSKTVYVSKLRFGQEDSDSVWYLQDALNAHPLSGGATLPTTGGYFSMTDAEVIKCQTQHGFGADPPGASFVGPSQAEHLFAGRGLTVVYDTGNPSPPDPDPGPPDQEKPPAPALMLPGAVWDPITNFPGLRPFTGSAKKVTLHTTETSVKPNWEAQQSGIPHLTVDLDSGQRWQHLPFDLAAYTLSGGDNSPNSASGVNIQIELIGYTADCPSWPAEDYADLRQVLEWLGANLAIPYGFPHSFSSPIRLDWPYWESASGILGHCHAPYNDHSDPTGLRVDLLTGTVPEPEPEPVYVTLAEYEADKQAHDEMLISIMEAISTYLHG